MNKRKAIFIFSIDVLVGNHSDDVSSIKAAVLVSIDFLFNYQLTFINSRSIHYYRDLVLFLNTMLTNGRTMQRLVHNILKMTCVLERKILAF